MEGAIYTYGVPQIRSAEQKRYIEQRVQQRLAEVHQRQRSEELQRQLSGGTVASTTSNSSAGSGGKNDRKKLRRTSTEDSGYWHAPTITSAGRDAEMEQQLSQPRAAGASISSASTGSSHSQEQIVADLLANPFELRHGRRYLRDLAYPLPCDLAEIQRQNLRTLLGCSVFGRAVCSPKATKNVPQKVLEVGCGSAYWSARCHEHFTSCGHRNVSFTGLDIAPLAPDLKKQGVNWNFVQHDLRRNPWPFEDEEFDLIMLKDLSLVVPLGSASQKLLDECIRLLKVGGTLEIWESDHILRSLLPHPPPPTSRQRAEQDVALSTGTFLVAPGTPFAQAGNKYLNHANTWITEALDRRKLPPSPCARIAQVLYQEPESLGDVGMRRVAIPLGELRWERDSYKHSRSKSDADDLVSGKGKARAGEKTLTPDQAALRQTALLSVLQMIESFEPLLKEVSGKNSEEWGHWWQSMMADMLDPNRGAVNGECLEVGAWWATKLEDPDA